MKNEIRTISSTIQPRRLVCTFTTHHHPVHSSGDILMKKMFPSIVQVSNFEEIMFIQGCSIRCILTPSHTLDSMCINNKYYV
jgi:glyoxylase-like metal-dependent hydrolase (beta-lactamase superfamily II)